MSNNRNPADKFNGSGYIDKTAFHAISKADRELLKLRRTQTMNRLRSVVKEHGFRICGDIILLDSQKFMPPYQ